MEAVKYIESFDIWFWNFDNIDSFFFFSCQTATDSWSFNLYSQIILLKVYQLDIADFLHLYSYKNIILLGKKIEKYSFTQDTSIFNIMSFLAHVPT